MFNISADISAHIARLFFDRRPFLAIFQAITAKFS